MTLYHTERALLLAVLASFAASIANAQSTNCMAMGPDMVQCYGANGSSTNCMKIGPDMAHCDTLGQSQSAGAKSDDVGNRGGHGWVDDLMPWREGNLRKKIGKMIVAGDCQGAAKLAYEKGRLELGAQIARTCTPTSAR